MINLKWIIALALPCLFLSCNNKGCCHWGSWTANGEITETILLREFSGEINLPEEKLKIQFNYDLEKDSVIICRNVVKREINPLNQEVQEKFSGLNKIVIRKCTSEMLVLYFPDSFSVVEFVR